MSIMYPIKSEFQKSRAVNKITMVLPEFITTLFHVIAIPSSLQGKEDFVLTKSSDTKEMCVTVSPNVNLVKFPNFNVVSIRGRELLKLIPQNSGVLIVYEDGADYLTAEHVNLFKQIID